MSFRRESEQTHYDAVVIGSGIGGLSSAAVLAVAGLRVLVVERHDRPGGYAHSFRRHRYRFDSAVHLTSGLNPNLGGQGGVLHELLSSLGVRDSVEFARIDPVYHVSFPGRVVSAYAGLERYTKELGRLFPGSQSELEELVGLSAVLRDQLAAADGANLSHAATSGEGFETLRRYRRATLGAVLEEKLSDPELRAAHSTLWPYLGLPPGELSFAYWSAMHTGYLADGAYYCKGTFQRLAQAFVEGIRNHGGEVLYRTRVRRILVSEDRAQGVVLENGQKISAPVVVSNADALQTAQELVGADRLPQAYLRSLRRLEPSLSGYVAYLATDLPLENLVRGHETFYYANYDHDRAAQCTRDGEVTWFSATVPTLIDPELAPPGQHLLILTTLAPFLDGDWRARKEPYLARLLALAEEQFPGLKKHLLHAEGGTPRTMERYTLNENGALYGWALTPDQTGPRRPSPITPLAGLYLAGHWAQPGGGIYAVAVSGKRVGEEIVAKFGQTPA